MLIPFFMKMREYKIPVSIRELLDLLSAMKHQVVFASIEDFYHVARLCLVKDETHFDKFDRAFADYFKGIQSLDLFSHDIPDEWLRKQLDRMFTEEEKKQVQAMGGLDELMDTLKKRLEEQKKGIKAEINGLVQEGHHPSALMVLTRKVCVLVRKATASFLL